MPQQLQVSFQGGGARFVEMLPAAHALAAAHARQRIAITRVAGSSAGSICAALVACGADFTKVRKFVVDNGGARVRNMRRWCTRPVKHSSWRVVRILKAPVKYSKTGIAIGRATWGRSLLNTPVLHTFLIDLFNASVGRSQLEIKSVDSICGIKLVITGSDLHRAQGVVFEEGNLLEKIVHSSAIPFAFRSFRDVAVSPIVDGGLCENLPVEQLLAREDFDGPVFCVSCSDAEETNYLPEGITDYCNQLISASINHNVLRAKRTVGASNTFETVASVDTFDFEAAIDRLADDQWYNERYWEADAKIRQIEQLFSVVNEILPDDNVPANLSGRLSAPKIMSSLARVFDDSPLRSDWEYRKSAFVVRAECLQSTDDRAPRLADHVMRLATIMAKGPNLVCFTSSAALNAEGSIVPTKWTAYNETRKRSLRIQPIPASKSGRDARGRIDVLIFFEDPKNAVAPGDVISIRSHYLGGEAMIGLEKVGQDYVSIENPHAVPIAETDIVLVYPSRLGRVSAVAEEKSLVRNNVKPIDDEVMRRWYLPPASGSWQAVGCTAANVLPGESFRVDFYKKS